MTTVSLTLLATMLLAVFCQSIIVANAQSDVATVIIQPSTGGTTDPAPGTYTYANGTNIVLTATPDAGYAFHYWIVSGNATPGHAPGIPNYIIDPDTGDVVGTIPRVPVPTGIDSLVFTTNPANITCGYGYTFQYQAVFTPAVSASPSPSPTASPTPSATASPTPVVTATPTATPESTSGGLSMEVIVAIVVVVIIIIVVIAAVMMRRKK